MTRKSKEDLNRGQVPNGDDVVHRAGREDPAAVGDLHADEVRGSRPFELDDVKAVAAVGHRDVDQQQLVRGHGQKPVRVRDKGLRNDTVLNQISSNALQFALMHSSLR